MSELSRIHIGERGTFRESGEHHTTPEQVDSIISYLVNEEIERLIIYSHGGLVSESRGMGGAEIFEEVFLKPGQKQHVVSLIWESGLWETIRDNWPDLLKKRAVSWLIGKIFDRLKNRYGFEDKAITGFEVDYSEILKDPLYYQKLLEAPEIDFDKIEDLDTKKTEADLINELEEEFLTDFEENPDSMIIFDFDEEDYPEDFIETFTDPETKSFFISKFKLGVLLARVAYRVIQRRRNHRWHGTGTTILEETLRRVALGQTGADIWEYMKDKAGDMWKDNEGVEGNNRYAGRYFLDGLEPLIKNGLKIDFIGHSAGSIVFNEMMTVMDDKQLSYDHVFFLAPACTTGEFLNKVINSDNGRTKENRLNTFLTLTLTDEAEINDSAMIYPRSILYLISGLLEDKGGVPLLGMQYYLNGIKEGYFDRLKPVHQYLFNNSEPAKIHFSPSGGSVPGNITLTAERHTHFNEKEKGTLELIDKIISDGVIA